MKRSEEGGTENEGSSLGNKRRGMRSFSYSISSECLYCGEGNKSNGKKPTKRLVRIIEEKVDDSLRKACNDRNDEWKEEVEKRFQYILLNFESLKDGKAVYHSKCRCNFYDPSYKLPPGMRGGLDTKRGRCINDEKKEAFARCCEYLESRNDETVTLSKLVKKMEEFLSDSNEFPYTQING